MPLFANSIRLGDYDPRLYTFDVFIQHFGEFYKEKADKLKSERIKMVGPSDLCLYVGLQEEGGVRKTDRRIEMLGTDGIKKCIAVVLGCEQGMVLSHIEASSVKRSVILMMDAISKIMIGKLSFPNPEAFPEKLDLNLHVIGGYDDHDKRCEDLAIRILQMFCDAAVGGDTQVNVRLQTFCCAKLNSELVPEDEVDSEIVLGVDLSRVHEPIIDGFVVDVNTEEIMPARFCDDSRGPLSFARNIRTIFAIDPITRIYDWERDQFVLVEFEYREWDNVDAYNYRLVKYEPSARIFRRLSPAPHLEPEEFPELMLELYKHRRKNPDPKQAFFPKGPELRLVKSGSEWINVDDMRHDSTTELQHVSGTFLSKLSLLNA